MISEDIDSKEYIPWNQRTWSPAYSLILAIVIPIFFVPILGSLAFLLYGSGAQWIPFNFFYVFPSVTGIAWFVILVRNQRIKGVGGKLTALLISLIVAFITGVISIIAILMILLAFSK